VTFSFRFNNGHLTRLPEHQEHLHLDSVSIQLSGSLFILLVLACMRFFISSNYRVFVIEFCVLLHFIQI